MNEDAMPKSMWLNKWYDATPEPPEGASIEYIRADVCAERQNAIQSEVYAERMLADGLRKQLDAANARIAELEAAMVAINRLGSGVVTRRAAHLALQT